MKTPHAARPGPDGGARIGPKANRPAVAAGYIVDHTGGHSVTLLRHGLLTVPHHPTGGLPPPCRGDLRSQGRRGRETLPQRGGIAAERKKVSPCGSVDASKENLMKTLRLVPVWAVAALALTVLVSPGVRPAS